MTISNKGVLFICEFEGFSAKPYSDPASGGEPYTIGYGTTIYPNGRKVTLADPQVTKEQAAGFVLHHVDATISPQLSQMYPNLQQHQFDALCSFAYNLGMGNFRISELRKSVAAGADAATITNNFNNWVKGGGKIMPGLVRRRAAEAKLYCTGEYGL